VDDISSNSLSRHGRQWVPGCVDSEYPFSA
jgi:hypothetical protein